MNTTIDCLNVRRILGADPQSCSPDVVRHCISCPGCAAYRKEMLDLDVRLTGALAIEVPEGLEARIVFNTAFQQEHRRSYRWLAAAAVVVLAMCVGLGMRWLYVRQSNVRLAETMVQHVMRQSQALTSTTPLTDASISAVLERVGAKLHGRMGPITYADTFSMQGQMGAHLVMMTPHGAVVVLLMPHIHLSNRMQMNTQGFHCVIDPMGAGSIAIVASVTMPMDGMEQQIMSMVHWVS